MGEGDTPELNKTQIVTGSSKPEKQNPNKLRIRSITKEIDSTPTYNEIKIVEGVDQETPAQDIVEQLDLPPFESAIFVMGGASKVEPEVVQKIQYVLSTALSEVAIKKRGEIFVGDGGTKSGVMIATGEARRIASQYSADFPLVGVSPKEEVKDFGNLDKKTEIDPNHSHAVPVASKPEEIGQWGAWGNETTKMYELFGKLAENKSSVGIVINGGEITINEVLENLKQRRDLIVLKGSGRATDNIVHLLEMKRNPFTEESDFLDLNESLQTLKQTLDSTDPQWFTRFTIVDLNQEKPEEALEDAILKALE